MIDLFPATKLTLPITVTATASTSTALPSVGNTIKILNEGPSVAFFSIGTGTQTATLPNATPTNTSNPILPGAEVVLNIPNPGSAGTAGTPLNISAICRAGGSCTLDVQVGEGQ